MARKEGNRGQRRSRGTIARPRRGAKGPLITVGVVVAGLGAWVLSGGAAPASHHPEPRSDITGGTVVPASTYAAYPRVEEVYREAAEAASFLDGVYCYCQCIEHAGHRSLLTCFESDHAAGCDVCLSEGAITFRMMKDGSTLAEVRNAVDDMYGT